MLPTLFGECNIISIHRERERERERGCKKMLKRFTCSVLELLGLILYIQVVSSQLPSDQVSVMTKVYEIFQSDTRSRSTFFVWSDVQKGSDPCSWDGVLCSLDYSSIYELSFRSFSISNSEFLPLLCNITTLESLDVSDNCLSTIPEEFSTGCGKLDRLKLLSFGWNKLNGSLPTFNGFIMLEHLDFYYNSFTGEINLQLNGLDSLKSLNLSKNQFTGTVPTNLGKLNTLEELHLSGNLFTGEIPVEITKYRNLSVIDLSVNHLSGSIPGEMEELTRLETLVLSVNNITGGIPKTLSNITTLKRFAAKHNKLSGTIPSDLLSGPNLHTVDLSYNELEGPIPESFSMKLLRLRLGSNSLKGTIPSDSLGSLAELMYLELENNSLSGEIPLGLGTCKKLVVLNLALNRLTGRLSPVLGYLTNLQVLSLEMNNFVGEIPPQISSLSRLEKLNISRNSLNGSIPLSIASLKNLTHLDLQSNNLSGTIPDSVASLSFLIEMQLGKNQLGRIPDMPPNLQLALNLSYNLFNGPIPVTISKLNGLEVLDLSNNRFSGQIPGFLTGLGRLTQLLLSNNELSGVVPKFKYLAVLDVKGNNNLIIPRENPVSQKRRISLASAIVIAVASAATTVGLLTVIALFVSRSYKRIHVKLLTPNSIHMSNFDFKKLMDSVTDPSNITVRTRFSTYYKAVMPSGTSYFVKKVNRSNKIFKLRSHENFGEELEVLGKLCNANVMIPIAYVLTAGNCYLFYDFAPEGALYDVLHDRTGNTLDWASRYSIAVGVSQGLAFLHECDSGPILLLDLSSKIILLNSLNEPQIGDIELCKVIQPSKSRGSISTLAGSVGYVPPEYAYTMRVTAAGNVYSFGVVLLELLTGKPAISEGTELTKWVLSNSNRQDKRDEILDFSVSKTSAAVRSQMLAVLEVALACISISPETRPNTISVLQMLLNARSYNGEGESEGLH